MSKEATLTRSRIQNAIDRGDGVMEVTLTDPAMVDILMHHAQELGFDVYSTIKQIGEFSYEWTVNITKD